MSYDRNVKRWAKNQLLLGTIIVAGYGLFRLIEYLFF